MAPKIEILGLESPRSDHTSSLAEKKAQDGKHKQKPADRKPKVILIDQWEDGAEVTNNIADFDTIGLDPPRRPGSDGSSHSSSYLSD